MFKSIFLSLILSLSLTACFSYPPPEPIEFETDARILRGVWTGTLENYPEEGSEANLSFSLTATYQSASDYLFEGSVQIDDASFAITGTVNGGGEQTYLAPQTSGSPPISVRATLSTPEGKEVATLNAYQFRSDIHFFGALNFTEGTELLSSHSWFIRKDP